MIVTVLHFSFLFGHFSGGGVVSICYNITLEGGSEKCYIGYIGWVGDPKNKIFALFDM